jgi:hypothetical protein
MVKLEKGGGSAPPAGLRYKRAPPAVAGYDRPLDVRRDVPRRGGLTARHAWLFRRPKLLSRELGQKRSQCTVEDFRRISIRHGMPEQVLGQPQLLAGRRAGCESDLITIRGERRDQLQTGT